MSILTDDFGPAHDGKVSEVMIRGNKNEVACGSVGWSRNGNDQHGSLAN
jgi:hypothetical protein